jgi:hypothetical protein
MPTESPYELTTVPVARSQEQIRKALKEAGALGVQFDELWENGDTTGLVVRFIWPVGQGKATVRLQVTPLAPKPGKRTAWAVSPEQRERQAWRSLAWYLDAMIKSAQFGLLKFEDIFLSFIEDNNGQTVGEYIIPQLQAGMLALPRGEG